MLSDVAKVLLASGLVVATLVIGIFAFVLIQANPNTSASPSSANGVSTMITTVSKTSLTQTSATSCSSQNRPSSTISATTNTASSISGTTITGSSTSSSTETHTVSSTAVNGSLISYFPSYPIKVESAQATIIPDQNGNRSVIFSVAFENIGNSSIYVIGGCGSGLSSFIPADSSVIQRTTGGPVCLCAEFAMSVNPGENHTSTTPGCWTVYKYMLIQPGTVEINFTLGWSESSQQSFRTSNSTLISGTFTFP